MTDLLSINEAVAQGIERVRKPIWANPLDHIKIDIINGKLGPWLHFYSPMNQECNKRDPVDFLTFEPVAGDRDEKQYLVYDGPLSTSDEYQKKVAEFVGLFD